MPEKCAHMKNKAVSHSVKRAVSPGVELVSINGDPTLMTSPILQEIHTGAFVLFGVYFGTWYQDFMQ